MRNGSFAVAWCLCMLLASGCSTPGADGTAGHAEADAAQLELDARARAARGDVEGALAAFHAAIAAEPDRIGALAGLATYLLALGHPEEAVARLEDMVARGLANEEVHLELGVAREALGDEVGALEAYHDCLKLNSRYVPAIVNTGNIILNLGAHDKAEEFYRRAHEFEPDHPGVLLSLGNVCYLRDKLDESEQFLRAALAVTPEDGAVHYALGRVAIDRGDAQTAEAALGEALRLDPRHYDARMRLVQLLDRRDAREAVHGHLAVMAEHAPRDAESQWLMGLTFSKHQHHGDAIRHFDAALAEDPSFGKAHRDRAVVLLQLERPAEALASLERTLRTLPQDPTTRYLFGLCHVSLGDLPRAREDLKLLVELDPDLAEDLRAVLRTAAFTRGEATG